jgi:hypothetical protein
MSDDKTDPLGKKPAGDTDPKKPKATIDLKATVVETRDMPRSGAEAATKYGARSTEAKAEAASSGAATPSADQKPGETSSGATAGTGTSGATPPPAAGEPPRRSGFLSHVLAGVAGALLTLFGANIASDRLGLGGANVDDLTSRIATLEAELKEQAADTSESVLRDRMARIESDLTAAAAWKEKVAALEVAQTKASATIAETEAKIAELAARPAGAEGLDAALIERLESMDKRLDTIAEASKTGAGGPVAGLAALTGRINDFETELASRVDGVKKAFEERLVKEVAGLDSRLAEGLTAGSGATVQIATIKESNLRLGRDIEGLKLTSERLQQSIDAVRGSTEEIRTEVQKLAGSGDQTRQSIDKLSGDLNSAIGLRVTTEDLTKTLDPVASRLAAIEGEIATLKTSEHNRNEAASRILLSLELTNLRRAIERGGSFAKELAAVTAIAPKELDLTVLAAHAEKGLPSIASLEAAFGATANAALDAERAGDADASVLDQLWNGAQSVVRIRRTGEVAGDTTEAIVARMEQRLAASDLEGVAKESAALGEAPKAVVAPWLNELEARMAVYRALTRIEDDLKRLIGGGASASGTN